MTKSTTPSTEQITEQAHTPASATVEPIDPATAVIDENIRTVVDLDPAFVAQIKSEGVRVPVLARRDDDGTVRVWDGQRRLLAAREAGLTSILAIFGTSDATKVARITDQLTSFNRDDLGTLDRINAYEQLALEGVSVARIAKTTGTDKAAVAASLALAKSEQARESVDFDSLSLDVAIYLAEFADNPDAMHTITEAAAEDGVDVLPFIVQQLRDEQKLAAHEATILASYAAQGIATSTEHWGHGGTMLSDLTDDPDSDGRPALDADAHVSCPGHTMVVLVDGLGENDTTAYPVCRQRELHHSRYRYVATGAAARPEQTAEEAEAVAEAKRVERRRVIANNKAWDTAQTVRRDWLRTLVTRRTLPKNAAQFIAATLTAYRYEVSNSSPSLAQKLLGVDGYDGLAKYVEATPTRAAHVTLAVALGGREQATCRESWRYPSTSPKTYLLQLEAWGYHLSAVERIAAGYPEAPAEDATDEPAETAETATSEDATDEVAETATAVTSEDTADSAAQ